MVTKIAVGISRVCLFKMLSEIKNEAFMTSFNIKVPVLISYFKDPRMFQLK